MQPTANPALFPAFVAQHSVAFDAEDDADLATQFPGITIPESLARAARKRRVEYCAGRFCAREALRVCSPAYADAPIPSGPHGNPLWPCEIVGAITHTHEFASAAVALRRQARAIGLDAERVTETVLAAVDHVAARDEISALVRATCWSSASVFGVVFSAKETIFKCLYPQVRRYFDFRDVMIEALDPDKGRFSARLLVALTPTLVPGTRLNGRFERREDLVCTAMVFA